MTDERLAAICDQQLRTIRSSTDNLEVAAATYIVHIVELDAEHRQCDAPGLLDALYRAMLAIIGELRAQIARKTQASHQLFDSLFASLRHSVRQQFQAKTEAEQRDWLDLFCAQVPFRSLTADAAGMVLNDACTGLEATVALTVLDHLTARAIAAEPPLRKAARAILFEPLRLARSEAGGQPAVAIGHPIGPVWLAVNRSERALERSTYLQCTARLLYLAVTGAELAQLALLSVYGTEGASSHERALHIAVRGLYGDEAGSLVDAASNQIVTDLEQGRIEGLLDPNRRELVMLYAAIVSRLPEVTVLPGPLVTFRAWFTLHQLSHNERLAPLVECYQHPTVLGRLRSYADTLIDDLRTRASRGLRNEGEYCAMPPSVPDPLRQFFPWLRLANRSEGEPTVATLGLVANWGSIVSVEPALDADRWITPENVIGALLTLFALAVLHDLVVPLRQTVGRSELIERYGRRHEAPPGDLVCGSRSSGTVVRVQWRVVLDEPYQPTTNRPRRQVQMELEGDDPRPLVSNRPFWRRCVRHGVPLQMTREQFLLWADYHRSTGLCAYDERVTEFVDDGAEVEISGVTYHQPIGFTWHGESREFARGLLPGETTARARRIVLVADTAVQQLTQLLELPV